MRTPSSVPALDGLRVLDLSTGIAGPVAGMFLADHGADVVKAEPPGGDPARSLPGFAVWNRGKRSVVADEDRVTELLGCADVCITGAEPLPLGLAPDAATRAYPGLIHLQVPPYGHTTPWAGGRESHGLLAAATGVALRQSSGHDGPIEIIYPHVLYAQGAWAATCALAALLERERSGRGQTVTVGGLHGALITSTGSLCIDPTLPPRNTATGPGGANPCYTRYVCSDGAWLFLGALTPKFIDRAFAVLGIADVLEDPRIGGDRDRLYEPDNRDWVRARMAESFASLPRDEWLRLLAEADCPAGPLERRDGWLDHPQIVENDLRLELDDPERGHVVMPANPVALADTPGSVRGPAPRLGADDLPGWSPAPARAESADEPGAGPLDGLRVVGLGTFIAGAYPAMLLAELGADVVKVEPPAGDPFRVNGFTYNRGTRSVALDLRDPRGHDAFLRLVDDADAVIENYRAGVVDRLGVGYDALAARNPRVVSASVTAYGDHGPHAKDPGFDPILQARSGMMTAQGGAGEPVFHTIPVDDVSAGVLAAFGVCAALVARNRTGRGQRVTTSLAAASVFMQNGELVRYDGRPPAPIGGPDHLGHSDLDRFYPAADGWVRIAAAPDDRTAVESALGADLAAAIAALPADEVVKRLADAGVPAVRARTFEELCADPDARATEVVHEQDGYISAGRFAWFERTRLHKRLVPPGCGEHTEAVLREAGLDAETLIAEGIAVTGEPMRPRIRDYR